MADQDKSSPSIDFRTLLLLVTVLAGAYILPSSLRSARPEEKATLQRTALGDQVVPARLWEDPLEVAVAYHLRHRDKAPQSLKESEPASNSVPFYSLKELCQQIVRHSQSNALPVTLLEVFVSGGSYAENAEERLRDRYAVLSALHTANYIPADAEHLGYAQTDWPRGEELEGGALDQLHALRGMPNRRERTLVLPFEWFTPNPLSPSPQRTNDLLVLWLNADDFDDYPLARLVQLNRFLKRQSTELGQRASQFQLKVLEPRLERLLEELNQSQARSTSTNLERVRTNALPCLELYSSWSTSPDALLQPISRPALTGNYGGQDLSFLNVTCTDEQLAEELIDELELRRVDLANPSHRIILISEWDTFYGRALPLTFAAMVLCRLNDRFCAGSFRDPAGLLLALQTNALPPYAFIRGQLSGVAPRLLAQPAVPFDRTEALAEGFNALLPADLSAATVPPNLVHLPVLRAPVGNLCPGRRLHLNRLRLDTTFPEFLRPNNFEAAVALLKTNAAAWPSNIVLYTYLRGVDGKVPDQTDAEASPEKSAAISGKPDETDRAGALQRPEGHSQLDYLPRLAGSLEEVEQRLHREHGGDFKAIGVLGSDVYDKLLIFQALRHHFTDELFFTTDLDARLLHPQALKSTRNVLVASSFGLALHPALQKEIPPFRDTYQTGQYLACLAALDVPGVRAHLPGGLSPRRYELGRQGACDLSLQDSPFHPPLPRPATPREMLRSLEKQSWWLMVAALGLLAAFLSSRARQTLGLLFSMRLFGDVHRSGPPFLKGWGQFRLVTWLMLLAGAAVSSGLVLSILYDHCSRTGEPFSWTNGTSTWPTELLRLVAAGLAVGFVFKAQADLRKNQAALEKELPKGIPTPSDDSPPAPSRPPGLWPGLLGLVLPSWSDKHSAEETPKRTLYEQYSTCTGFWSRFWRILLPALLCSALACLVYELFDFPFQPARGRSSFRWDTTLWCVSDFFLLWLILYVVDASRLCAGFIRRIGESRLPWSGDVRPKPEAEVPDDCSDAATDLLVIARRSDAVNRLIFYPFFVILIILLSRNNFFDRWDWPPSLLLFLGLSSAFAIYSVWVLRRAAEAAREGLLTRLNGKLLSALHQPDSGETAQLRFMIEKVESCQEGAFAPITRQPVIKALLMPFGGAGLLTLLNYLEPRL